MLDKVTETAAGHLLVFSYIDSGDSLQGQLRSHLESTFAK